MDFISRFKGYQQWGQVLGVIAKLRWFEDNNYLQGFCVNHGYDFNELQIFLKVSNSIINGHIYADLKMEYNNIKNADTWSPDELSILNGLLA